MTVKEKLLHPESKDVLLYNRIPNDSSYDLLPGDDNLLPNNEINLQRNSLVIDDLDDTETEPIDGVYFSDGYGEEEVADNEN